MSRVGHEQPAVTGAMLRWRRLHGMTVAGGLGEQTGHHIEPEGRDARGERIRELRAHVVDVVAPGGHGRDKGRVTDR